jgi:very-short-patch-repair endonuclease
MRAPTKTIGTAQHLRRQLSVPEARLWNRLRLRAPGKPVFRRQHPIGPYVLDFYCAKARLAIEIDGASHDMGNRPQRDIRRDAWLEEHGVTVVRIVANDLTRAIDEAADAIVRMAAARLEQAGRSLFICAADRVLDSEAPSTALRAVPLPRFAGAERVHCTFSPIKFAIKLR